MLDLITMGARQGEPLPPPCRCWCGCFLPTKRPACLLCQLGYHGFLKECDIA